MEQRDPLLRKDDVWSCHFESMTEFLEYQHPEDNVNHWKWERDMARKVAGHRSRGFYGHYKNPAKVLDAAIVGDEYMGGVLESHWKRLDDVTGKNTTDYQQRIKVAKRRKRKDMYGDELDIHKVYQGHLDTAWTRTERIVQDIKHNLVSIFVDFGGSAAVRMEDTLWRSAVACRLVRELEQAGKSVKVVVGGACANLLHRTRDVTTYSVTVKDFNQPLSLERLAAMTNIAFFRSFGFAAMQCFPKDTIPGYGRPVRASEYMPRQLKEDVDAGHARFVYIDKADTVDAAKRELEGAYRQLEELAKEAA